MLVMGLNEAADSRSQVSHAAEGITIKRPSFQLRKPALHGVQPRGAGRREMQLETGMLLQPLPDGRSLVSRAVVQNYMQVQLGRGAAVNLPKELQKLFGPVSLGDAADDLAGQDVKGGIQASRTVTFVVMRPPLNLAGLERQHRLRAIQRLDLRFFINRQY